MKLENSEIDTWLASHPKWQRDGDLLQREVTLSSFRGHRLRGANWVLGRSS